MSQIYSATRNDGQEVALYQNNNGQYEVTLRYGYIRRIIATAESMSMAYRLYNNAFNYA